MKIQYKFNFIHFQKHVLFLKALDFYFILFRLFFTLIILENVKELTAMSKNRI